MNKLFLVGIGPGSADGMTQAAKAALEQSEVLCGYTVYLDLVRQQYPDKETYTTPMTRELERCRWAIDRAAEGKTVAMLCSGDAGVYGMAGPVLELAEGKAIEIEVVPGITAACGGAAVLGAPLTHDFAVISLSDLLTPWPLIEKRLRGAAAADFVICLYNPASKNRPDHLARACDILLEEKAGDTLCGYVRNVGRAGEQAAICTLEQLRSAQVDMFTTVIVGSSQTKRLGDKLVTPRGYLQREG